MRILYFTRDYTPHDHRFAGTLAEQGIDVFYLRLERGTRQLEDRPLPPAVRQVVWRGGRSRFRWQDVPALLLDLKSVLRQVRPDILHAGPIQTAAFLGALSGFRPLVTMSWGSDLLRDAYKNALYRRITAYTLNRSTVLVGDCQAVREGGIKFGVAPQKIFTFPWGIDLNRFQPEKTDPEALALRSRLGWQSNFVVLSLRSWEPVYGIDVLLRGFAQAAQAAPDLRMLMMGGGSQAGLVHQMIQQYDLAEKIHLGGHINQNDLPKIYHAADVYISASHSDGSSVSLMEALGCGLPVLVSDIPSNREWVTEGEQGWLFPDGDDAALAKKLLSAKDAAKGLDLIGSSAREQALQKADWTKNFNVLLQAYDLALKANN